MVFFLNNIVFFFNIYIKNPVQRFYENYKYSSKSNTQECYTFIDDQTKDDKIIFMTFREYFLDSLAEYFPNTDTHKILFIKKEHKLPDKLINEIKKYEYLEDYFELNKLSDFENWVIKNHFYDMNIKKKIDCLWNI